MSVAVLATGCGASSASFTDSARKTIEADLSDQLGFEALRATCSRPNGTAVGTTFTCGATTEDGRTIELVAEITGSRAVQVEPTNLVTSGQLRDVRRAIADRWESQTGAPVGADSISCGDETIVLDAGGRLPCTITDPATDDATDVLVTLDVAQSLVTDIEPVT